MIFFINILLSIVTYAQITENLTIQLDGKTVKVLTPSELKKIPKSKIDFYNYVTKRVETYNGLPLNAVTKLALPEKAQQIVELEFKSINGYVSYFTQDMFDKTPAFLGFERADGEKFIRYSQKEKALISLAPYYLLWEQPELLKDEQLILNSIFQINQVNYLMDFAPYSLVWDQSESPKDEHLVFNSVYQINQINYLTNKINFGLVTDKVEGNLILGLRTYKKYCLSCHALGKLGGNIGINLLDKDILTRKGEDYFVKYTLTPASINPYTAMLPLPQFRNNQEMVKGLIEFLQFTKNPAPVLKKIKESTRREHYDELSKLVEEMKN